MKLGVGGRWVVAGPKMPTDTTYYRDLSCLSVPSSMHIERLLVGPSDELGLLGPGHASLRPTARVGQSVRAMTACDSV